MDGRRSSNAWKYLMVIAIVCVVTAPFIVSMKKGGPTKLDPARTAVANWMAGATPIPTGTHAGLLPGKWARLVRNRPEGFRPCWRLSR